MVRSETLHCPAKGLELPQYERATGKFVKGKSHIEKGQNDIRGLRDWLRENPSAKPGDRAAAENVLKDLADALGELTP